MVSLWIKIVLVLVAVLLLLFVVILPLAVKWPFSYTSSGNEKSSVDTAPPPRVPLKPPTPLEQSNTKAPAPTFQVLERSSFSPSTIPLGVRVYDTGDMLTGMARLSSERGQSLVSFGVSKEDGKVSWQSQDTVIPENFTLEGEVLTDKVIMLEVGDREVNTYLVYEEGSFELLEDVSFASGLVHPVIHGFVENGLESTFVVYGDDRNAKVLRCNELVNNQSYREGPTYAHTFDIICACVGTHSGAVNILYADEHDNLLIDTIIFDGTNFTNVNLPKGLGFKASDYSCTASATRTGERVCVNSRDHMTSLAFTGTDGWFAQSVALPGQKGVPELPGTFTIMSPCVNDTELGVYLIDPIGGTIGTTEYKTLTSSKGSIPHPLSMTITTGGLYWVISINADSSDLVILQSK